MIILRRVDQRTLLCRARSGAIVEKLQIAFIACAEPVIGDGIISIIVERPGPAFEIAGRRYDVPVADMAMDAQRRLIPAVIVAGLVIIMDFQVADARVEPEIAIGDLLLRRDFRRDRPAIDWLPQQLQAAAKFLDRVIIILGDVAIVEIEEGRRIIVAQRIDRRRAIIEQAVIGYIVDIAAIAPIIAHGAHRHRVAQRHVDVGFELPAKIALAIFIGLDVIAEFEFVQLGLVGDQADRPRERPRAIERALRPRQRLDPLQVIGMNVGDFGAGDRNIVQIIADRCISAACRHDAAEKGGIAAWPDAFERDGGQQRGEIAQAFHLALRQRFGTQRQHGDRHFLDALRAARRGHDDFAKAR